MKKTAGLLVLTTIIIWSCGKDDDEKCAFTPDISSIKIDINLERFEDSLLNIKSKNQLIGLLTRQPIMRDFIFKRQEYPNDSVFINELYNRFTNPHIDSLLLETNAVFGDRSELKNQFTEAFSNLTYYYPGFKVPRVQTVISGLSGQDLFVSDSLIIVSLDYFLGRGAKYRPNMYEYLLRQYEKENIVPSCMLIYGISDRFNKTSPDDRTVLADMIAYGKSYYFAKQMMPCVPDSIFIWYTPAEIKGSRKNQDLIWARLIQDQVLYSTSHLTKQKYLAERPKTIDVGPECPGRIAQWVGWQIVKSYMESKPEETLPQLMKRENARKLLEESRYTRKFKNVKS